MWVPTAEMSDAIKGMYTKAYDDALEEEVQVVPGAVAATTCGSCGTASVVPSVVDKITPLDCPKCGKTLPIPAAWVTPQLVRD